MAIHLPDRRYLTFGELQDRWKCEANDIREVVCSGALVPSWLVEAEAPWSEWIANERQLGGPELLLQPRLISDREAFFALPGNWYFLRMPRETGALDCSFNALCTSPTDSPEPDDEFPPVAFWYLLRDPIRLRQVEARGAFMLTEVARFESIASTLGEIAAERPVGTRERNTLLAIIKVLGGLAQLPLSQTSKAAEAIVDEAAKNGLNLSRRTVEEKLKLIPQAQAARGR